jgi:hypothetical protein
MLTLKVPQIVSTNQNKAFKNGHFSMVYLKHQHTEKANSDANGPIFCKIRQFFFSLILQRLYDIRL